MMPARPELIFLRHGETEWNREGRFQGARDSRLTELGRAQALALGARLAELGVGPGTHAALTSPQGRARDTAQIALRPLGLEPAEDTRLCEIGMGGWTGLTRREIDGRWPGPLGEPVLDFYARCPGGEPLSDLALRAAAVLEGIGRPTVIVTHGITLRVLCALATGREVAEAGRIEVRQGFLARIAGGRLEILAPQGLQDPARAR